MIKHSQIESSIKSFLAHLAPTCQLERSPQNLMGTHVVKEIDSRGTFTPISLLWFRDFLSLWTDTEGRQFPNIEILLVHWLRYVKIQIDEHSRVVDKVTKGCID